jgi:hypothetical protein
MRWFVKELKREGVEMRRNQDLWYFSLKPNFNFPEKQTEKHQMHGGWNETKYNIINFQLKT